LLGILFCDYPDTAEIYTLSLHDALPIFCNADRTQVTTIYRPLELFCYIAATDKYAKPLWAITQEPVLTMMKDQIFFVDKIDEISDRKSTRLNSSHVKISYAVFCLKKKII